MYSIWRGEHALAREQGVISITVCAGEGGGRIIVKLKRQNITIS